jgi:type VI secretion system protein ImpL
VLGWKLANLEELAGYIREYHGYLGKRHVDDSLSAFPLYVRVLRRQLQSVLDDGMSGAQVTATALRPDGGLDALATNEQALMQQSAELVRNYASLVWILNQYRQLGFDTATRVSQCVRRYASEAPERLALLSEASALYEVPPDDLDNGGSDSLFELGDAPHAKDYLQGQFQRVQVLSSYAGPFVSLLQNTTGNGDPTQARAASPAYWDNTRQEVNRILQFKDTNAQPALLNDFVLKYLAALTSDNCQDVLDGYKPASYGNDLFSERRRGLESQATWRCSDQGRAMALSQYQVWARRFGAEVAGRFPFSGLDANTEASLLVTRNFFADYAGQRDALRKKLVWLANQGLGDVAQFLDRLDVVAKLFGAQGADTESPPPLKLKVEFRALPSQSSGAQNIVSWHLATPDAAASYPNAPIEMEWHYGQPVTLVANWATLSPVVPVADPQQPDMQVDGNVVTFHAEGVWSLMRLILRHAAASAVRTDTLDQGVALLEFRVPTQGRQQKDPPSQSRFYVAIRLLGVDPKTQAPVPLRWPGAFPTSAPTVW